MSLNNKLCFTDKNKINNYCKILKVLIQLVNNTL